MDRGGGIDRDETAGRRLVDADFFLRGVVERADVRFENIALVEDAAADPEGRYPRHVSAVIELGAHIIRLRVDAESPTTHAFEQMPMNHPLETPEGGVLLRVQQL